jgi:hypothetical protein
MMGIIPLISTIISVTIFIVVVELIRRNRLKERYSLLWLFSCVIMILFSVSREFLHYASNLVGISYPPSFIFLFALLFLIIISIHFSTVVSELSDKNKILTQEIALLKEEMKKSTMLPNE